MNASAFTVPDPARAATIAVAFLQKLRPGGPWVLTSIVPDGKVETFTAQNEGEAIDFIARRSGKANLYYSVNPTWTVLNSKAAKADIAAIEYLLADLDPAEGETSEAAQARYLRALEGCQPPPTVIVKSGNGIQCLWRLEKPIPLPEPIIGKDGKKEFSPEGVALVADAEARSKALMETLGSVAGTQNIDRVLRNPGPPNLPTKKKRRAGRTISPTELIRFDDTSYPIDAFPMPERKKEEKKQSNGDGRSDVDRLPIPKRMKVLIKGIDDPAHQYRSRSERVMAVLVAMAAAGCTDEQIKMVMLDPTLPIGAHIRDNADPEKYLARQITEARLFAVDDDVSRINEDYALVIFGDKPVVMKTAGGELRALSMQAFSTWFGNCVIVRGDKVVPTAKYWLHHPQRRQYEGIEFAPSGGKPGYLNLWRGFAVAPRPGDCSKFLAHLRDNVCRGDDGLVRWVVGWFAQIFQHPDKKIGTSLVLRGKQGTGKTKVGEVIGSLLGTHYVVVSDPRYVTGRFNSHLVSGLLLHAEEAFWAGDHAAEGRLKDLVTGESHLIEFKGKEPVLVRNYVRLFVTGNPEWLVPAALEDRRFAVIDVGEDHMQDHAYFAAIDQEMDNGGREALLDYLLKFDLKQVNLRSIPKTPALLEQKFKSLSTEQAWWLDTLSRGSLPGAERKAPNCCRKQALFDAYIEHARRAGANRRAIETQIGTFLTKQVPKLRKPTATYEFPSLAECRAAFVAKLGQDLEWDEPNEWVGEAF